MARRLLFAIALVPLSASLARAQGLSCPEFQVNTHTTGPQAPSAVASDAAGNFVVVWQDYDQGGGFGRRFNPSGIPLGPEFPVDAGLLASDAAGNFVAVNTGDDGSFGGVFARQYTAAGVPLGPAFQVNSYTTDSQVPTGVAADPDGSFVVVWHSGHDGSGLGIFARLYDASGNPRGSEFQVNTYTTGEQWLPAVAMDASGSFVVVWDSTFHYGDGFGAVVGQRFNAAGGPQGPEFRVNTYTTYIQGEPAVASDPNGNVLVVWYSEYQDGDANGVFGQRYDATGAPVGPELPVNTHTTGYQSVPVVAASADGSFLVAWRNVTSTTPIEEDISARRFSASGAPEGPEFRVNTYTTGYQAGSKVAATTAGSFVVVWASDQQDGSSSGAFASVDCASRFYTVTPCRLADTRGPAGPSGGPPLAAQSTRAFPVSGICGIPADARAVAFNVAAVGPTDTGDLRLFPAGQAAPLASAVNFAAGRTRANNAVVPLGAGGQMAVQCDMPAGSTGSTNLVLDVYGYFKR